MELLEGETLQQRIKRLGQLEPRDLVRIVTHIARAVGRAHEAGVVHRDLKPENVFLVANDDEEIAKVLDFGVAKIDPTKLGSQSSSTRTGSLLGTPFYMSPEQVLGNKEVDSRSDLWSLAVIAFEALTGKRPFYSEGLGDLVLQITVRPLPVPSQFAPVPMGFDAWWERATARDPGARFESAKELADSLREALDVDAEDAGAVVTVPEPGEEQPGALTVGAARRPARSSAPTAQLDASPTAPTLLVGSASGARPTSTPAGAAARSHTRSPTRGARSRRPAPAAPDPARGVRDDDADVVSARTQHDRILLEESPPASTTGLALGVALVALLVGGGGTVAAFHYGAFGTPGTFDASAVAAPTPTLAAPRTRTAKKPLALTGSAAAHAGATSPPDPSAEPRSGTSPPPSASAEDGVAPPEDWLPRVVDGGVEMPEWAKPEPTAEPPPPPPPAHDDPYE
jgi:hypothetical protein